MAELFFLDAQTRRKDNRLTVFDPSLEGLMRSYQEWVRDCKCRTKDMWYANVFEVGTDRHVGYMKLGLDEEITYIPVSNSNISPYRRNMKQIIDWIVGMR